MHRNDSHRRHRGLSIILIVLILVLLVGFASLAVDIGRVRLAKAELQTAADAAALSGAKSLENGSESIELAIESALSTAAHNENLDVDSTHGQRRENSVELIPDEDIEFGMWRESTREFILVEGDGGQFDERRHCNAVRVWARRCTTFEKEEEGGAYHTVTRNAGLPLIFAPVLPDGPLRGEIQAKAIAQVRSGRTGFGFIGLDEVRLNGNTAIDSYNAATETYPGSDGPNDRGSVASNGDITLVGSSTVQGDARPGPDGSVDLNGNTEVSGLIFPMEHDLREDIDYTIPSFNPGTSSPNNDYDGDPPEIAQNRLYKRFRLGPGDDVTIDNSSGSVTIWVDGDFEMRAGSSITLKSNNRDNKVTFYVSGDLTINGGAIVLAAGSRPEMLSFNMTGANTTFFLRGMSSMSAHVNAPLSDVYIEGTGSFAFFGSIVGKSLNISGNSQLHHDQTSRKSGQPFKARLVK